MQRDEDVPSGVFRPLKAETKIDRAPAFRGLSLLVREAERITFTKKIR
jgi:hypothetical protein